MQKRTQMPPYYASIIEHFLGERRAAQMSASQVCFCVSAWNNSWIRVCFLLRVEKKRLDTAMLHINIHMNCSTHTLISVVALDYLPTLGYLPLR